ncbi:Up-regulated during septation-domain-containing protein [Crucibulum laeve]|uniref:Up-regulated during septation-domain-containing protein n=1 Tax=Crucibulum laeve TaxID=68775 RepID=A0A5C3MIS8_9AGAR|nr:Up-regulated during septation-domain-containing protein [Crucibulum laeve]
MNGVRRLLGTATGSSPPSPAQDQQSTAPLAFSSKAGPSWPPASPTVTQQSALPTDSPKASTAALFLKKDRQKSQPPADDDTPNSSFQSNRYSSRTTDSSFSSPNRSFNGPGSPISGPSSPRVQPNRLITRKSVTADGEYKRNSGPMNTRDELLMSLLASEAVVESRDFQILSSEEVEELKKEHQVLQSRLGAMSKKVSLETKIRDAAVSLSKVNASHKKVSKQTEEQLEAANRRVEAAQKELWRVSERANEVHKKLMEHRAGVLSLSVRSMEKKMAPNGDDSGYDSSNRSTLMSPTTSSMTGTSSSSKSRFDGAHLFAGHADTIVPKRKLSAEAAAAEITALEEKLKAATSSLAAASKKQVEMTRELSLMQLEKQEVETMMGMDLQTAEETILALEKELPRLEGMDEEVKKLMQERNEWEEERKKLEDKARLVEPLQSRLSDLEARNGDAEGTEKLLAQVRMEAEREIEAKEKLINALREEYEAEREAWDHERADMEDDKIEDLTRLQDEMDRLRDEDAAALQKANAELDSGLAVLQNLVKQHGIVLFSRDGSLQGMLESVGTHLEGVHAKLEGYVKAQGEWEAARRRLEDDVRSGLDKREAMAKELEEVRRERDLARRDTMTLESRVKLADAMGSTRSPITPISTFPPEFPITTDLDAAKIISILTPLWQILPSPEARAAKFSTPRPYRTGSPTPNGNSSNTPTSLSDLDVRSLKSLYDSRQTPTSPRMGNGAFSIEGFAQRVQALINDDRALIERLVRFAQAHDLLKKNAERAQKLAQEGNTALETYQKQVRILEERNMSMAARQAAMQEEVQQFQEAVDRISAQKSEVEMLAAEQAETCRQLSEANDVLSARTLTLAEEAASAPEMVRKQLETQLTECKNALAAAQDEIDAMRTSEQSQRIALLDELNSMQTENGALRAQLRAVKK